MRLAGTFINKLCTIMELKTPLYLLHPRIYHLETVVVGRQEGQYEFADSIFHLQGGGQPNDKGWIQVGQEKYDIAGGVNERQTGRLKYKLAVQADIPVGTPVKMIIDQQLRDKHMKIHSAGHLIDLAVERLKYQWATGKGYHFIDGPYVQYKGTIDNAEKSLNDLNHQLTNIIQEKVEASNKLYSYNEAVGLKIIPEEFKVGYVRVIGFATNSCPCGGTHISSTAQINSIIITKLQKKGKNARVYYRVDEIKKE